MGASTHRKRVAARHPERDSIPGRAHADNRACAHGFRCMLGNLRAGILFYCWQEDKERTGVQALALEGIEKLDGCCSCAPPD